MIHRLWLIDFLIKKWFQFFIKLCCHLWLVKSWPNRDFQRNPHRLGPLQSFEREFFYWRGLVFIFLLIHLWIRPDTMRGMSPGKRLTCQCQGSNLGCECKLWGFHPLGYQARLITNYFRPLTSHLSSKLAMIHFNYMYPNWSILISEWVVVSVKRKIN